MTEEGGGCLRERAGLRLVETQKEEAWKSTRRTTIVKEPGGRRRGAKPYKM